jgi:ABC-2 type transport system ATP-binding protein
MLEIQNLSVYYQQLAIIDQLNLVINKGSIHGLVGLNGSGKTTLFNTIFGLLKSQNGIITFDNQLLNSQKIAYLETHNYFYSFLTGGEYLELFKIHNKNFDIKSWNELFQLPLHQLIDEYSTGMKKKLAFIAILCLDKPIMLLDEPFNGLDMETNQQIKLIIKQLKEKGKTILITSHIMESLTSICDAISYLKHGSVEFTAIPTEFSTVEQRIFKETKTETLINKLL